MSNLGTTECFMQPSLDFHRIGKLNSAFKQVFYILTTCPCFDNIVFDIFDAGGLQCHFIMFVTIAVTI